MWVNFFHSNCVWKGAWNHFQVVTTPTSQLSDFSSKRRVNILNASLWMAYSYCSFSFAWLKSCNYIYILCRTTVLEKKVRSPWPIPRQISNYSFCLHFSQYTATPVKNWSIYIKLLLHTYICVSDPKFCNFIWHFIFCLEIMSPSWMWKSS